MSGEPVGDHGRGSGDGLHAYRDELRAIERRVAAQVEFGRRRWVIVGAVVVLLVALALPYLRHRIGWEVLADDRHLHLAQGTFFPIVFAHFVIVFGVVVSVATLATKRWAFAWVAMYGCALGTVIGFLALWSRQTTRHRAPFSADYGEAVAVVAMFVLAVTWIGIAWSRSNVMPPHERRPLHPSQR